MALTDPLSSVLLGMLLEHTIRTARQVEGANLGTFRSDSFFLMLEL
jgi:hypothetical protein